MDAIYLNRAQSALKIAVYVLQRKRLPARIVKARLQRTSQGDVWLFLTLDATQVLDPRPYEFMTDVISVNVKRPVVWLADRAYLYGVLLSQPRKLPARVDFPGMDPDQVRLGVGLDGEIAATRTDLGHLLVAGMSGSGKSTFLRTLGYQAKAHGAKLLISDLDNSTFPMFRNDSALLSPIGEGADMARNVIGRAVIEINYRAGLYGQVSGYPEKLDEYNRAAQADGKPALAPVWLFMDEAPSTIMNNGGPNGKFSEQISEIVFRGRKFGITFVMSAQDFTKSVLGRVRDQFGTVVCFRVKNPDTARNLGVDAAIRIPQGRVGLAVTDRWGAMQGYYLDKERMIESISPVDIVTPAERDLLMAAAANDGRVSRNVIMQTLKIGERQARNIQDDWVLRGWLERVPDADNAYHLTNLAVGLVGQSVGQAGHPVGQFEGPVGQSVGRLDTRLDTVGQVGRLDTFSPEMEQ